MWRPRPVGFLSLQLQQQQTRLMKINHDLRHRVTVVEAQGKALIEQKVELEADLQTKEQEMGSLRAELGKLRERLQGELNQNGEEEPVVSGKPASVGWLEVGQAALLSPLYLREIGGPERASFWPGDTQLDRGSAGPGTQDLHHSSPEYPAHWWLLGICCSFIHSNNY